MGVTEPDPGDTRGQRMAGLEAFSSLSMLPLEQRVAIAARTGAASVELGKPYRQVHWGNALRLVMFLIAVLYPLRWLSAICDRAA